METGIQSLKKPYIVWEPVPGLCIPSEIDRFIKAASFVDVVSPNLEELGSIFNLSFTKRDGIDMESLLDVCANLLFRKAESRLSCIIVRMGQLGCLVADKCGAVTIAAYHQPPQTKTVSKSPVIDPTGAGNAFLGGFCIGLQVPMRIAGLSSLNLATDRRYVFAAACGTIAASFAVEQVGMPILTSRSSAAGGEIEVWNDERVWDRIENFPVTKICRVQMNREWGDMHPLGDRES